MYIRLHSDAYWRDFVRKNIVCYSPFILKTVLCTIFSLSKQGTCIPQLIDKFGEKCLVLKKWRLRKRCFKNVWILDKHVWFYSDMKFEKAATSLFHFDVYYGFWLFIWNCLYPENLKWQWYFYSYDIKFFSRISKFIYNRTNFLSKRLFLSWRSWPQIVKTMADKEVTLIAAGSTFTVVGKDTIFLYTFCT